MPDTDTTPASERVAAYDRAFVLGLYERMFLVREFEEQVKFLFLQGSMPGTIHQCQGQEAIAVGVCSALNTDDMITSTHRPHGHALAKGLSPEVMLIELFGGVTGCCKGKGGSMHVGNIEKGMLPAIAIVGGGIPVATGMGLAFKMQRSSRVVASFFGEGATSEGAFHEGVNMAAIWDLPVLFVCENNMYAASTHVEKVTRLKNVADKALAYGMRSRTLDGNDVLAVYEAAREEVERCRAGEGPVLLEMKTYRITGHSRRDPCNYQPKEERNHWKEREPIQVFARALLTRDDVDPGALEAIHTGVEKRVTAAIAVGSEAPKPTEADLLTHVYA